MIHFVPDPDTAAPADAPGGPSLARLDSIRQALRLVEMTEGRPPRPAGDELAVEALWPFAAEPVRRCFDQRTIRTANAAAAGIETLLDCRARGTPAHAIAVDLLAETLQAGLADAERLFHAQA